MADYSLKKIFANNREGYDKYKAGQKSGKWSDYSDYQSQRGSSPGLGQNYQDVINKQKGEENTAISEYERILGNQPSVESEFNRIGQEYDLTGKRDLASKLASDYGAIEGTATTHGKNFGMSSSQIARRIGSLQGNAAPQLQEAQRIAGEASGQVGEKLNYAWQDLEKQLRPYTEKFSFLKDRLAREMTGFTQQAQNQLNLTLQKMQGGQAIDQIELQQAGELAKLEKAYEIKQRDTGTGTTIFGLDEPTSPSQSTNKNAILGSANAFQTALPNQSPYTPYSPTVNKYFGNNSISKKLTTLGGY